ncbi:patatin-like phospholipase family protein [Burkholderia ubonensis]|uniref:patatin-like phospholipase family protein n=1 Tax=Burkholderia ubonensis TaxID=101571 RepID=UPI0009B34DF0
MRGRIGLALSGGGVRAMAFHAGVLQWLATQSLLESVTAVSTVSGGTLFTGLVYRLSDWQWPSSEHYLKHVLPEIRNVLTTVCLQREAKLLLLTSPANWRYLFNRANVLALALQRRWNIDISVDDLSSSCEWSINGTTAETGRRFRFKQGRCGDYEVGYASSTKFALAEAMAASAAYPLLIGPLRIDATKFEWYKRPAWGGTVTDEQPIAPRYASLHVMDGGIYDNLGMEPLFDTGNQTLKSGIDFLVVSDAGAILLREPLAPQWRLRRLSRIAEIAMDQTRALRIRPFIHAILRSRSSGRYFQIGTNPVAELSKHYQGEPERANGPWLTAAETARAAQWPTDLKRLDPGAFDLIVRHGFETAAWNDLVFSSCTSNQNPTFDSIRGTV